MEAVISEPITTVEKTCVAEKVPSFSDRVHQSIAAYFTHLEGEDPQDLYSLVLAEMEKPLLKTVMQLTHGNQSKAAKLLGLSRGTLGKKLAFYQID